MTTLLKMRTANMMMVSSIAKIGECSLCARQGAQCFVAAITILTLPAWGGNFSFPQNINKENRFKTVQNLLPKLGHIPSLHSVPFFHITYQSILRLVWCLPSLWTVNTIRIWEELLAYVSWAVWMATGGVHTGSWKIRSLPKVPKGMWKTTRPQRGQNKSPDLIYRVRSIYSTDDICHPGDDMEVAENPCPRP